MGCQPERETKERILRGGEGGEGEEKRRRIGSWLPTDGAAEPMGAIVDRVQNQGPSSKLVWEG